jgi:hypothetical protein
MIHAIIKQELSDARVLAMKHGIDNFTVTHNNNNEIYIMLPNTRENQMGMISWFCDLDTGLNPPFASGSCLYYQWDK